MSLGYISVVVVALAIPSFCEGFSQDHTVVWFSPDVSVLRGYTQSQINSMVSTISSKFQILMSAWYSDDPSSHKIPQAVAEFNKLRRSPEQPQPPLELILVFRWNLVLHLVEDSAHLANLIYPNTVSTLIYEPKVFEEAGIISNVSTFSASLARRGRHRQYKFGLYLKIPHCLPDDDTTSHHHQHYLTPILDHIDLIFFEWFPTSAEHSEGAKATSEKLISLATPCKERMVALKPRLKVGFRTRWPSSTGPSGVQDGSETALFWSLMDEFADNSNSLVIPSYAFDQVGVDTDTFGWWRLKEGSVSSDEFVFVGKVHQNYSNLSGPQTAAPVGHSTGTAENAPGLLLFPLQGQSSTTTLPALNLTSWPSPYPRDDDHSTGVSESNPVMLAGGVCGVLVITIIAAGALFIAWRTFWKRKLPAQLSSKPEEARCFIGGIDLKISSDILGFGEFGIVTRGEILTDTGSWLEVAVKTSKPDSSLEVLQSLAAEIGILAFVGKHGHIVSLIGSQTDGPVYAILEFCARGTLEAHLRKLKKGSRSYYANMLVRDLKQWAYEISCGMEFLVSKNVVHGDLATRNILLGDNKIAKISDFGLSHRLDPNNGQYQVKPTGAIPWKWMSPEALRRVLSEKSDVWSFGVVLWEIYSLGESPYRDRSWTNDWISRLESGRLRLKKPRWSDSVMYAIMGSCWETEPSKRPPFTVLKLMIAHLGSPA